MEFLSTAIVGGLVNRYLRGGGLEPIGIKLGWSEKTLKWFDRINKAANDFLFALLFSSTLIAFPALYIGMLIGRSFGWGRYIGGIINKKIILDEEPESYLDAVLLHREDHPVLRCVVALTWRGVVWTGFIALGFYLATANISYLYLTPLGLTMGITYLVMVELCEKVTKNRGDGWWTGEIAFGAILWGGISVIRTLIERGAL